MVIYIGGSSMDSTNHHHIAVVQSASWIAYNTKKKARHSYSWYENIDIHRQKRWKRGIRCRETF